MKWILITETKTPSDVELINSAFNSDSSDENIQQLLIS